MKPTYIESAKPIYRLAFVDIALSGEHRYFDSRQIDICRCFAPPIDMCPKAHENKKSAPETETELTTYFTHQSTRAQITPSLRHALLLFRAHGSGVIFTHLYSLSARTMCRLSLSFQRGYSLRRYLHCIIIEYYFKKVK